MTPFEPLTPSTSSLARGTTVLRLLPANTKGRDLLIGDLHGCSDALLRGLDSLNFEPAKDRVLCTGDLVGRGPGSMAALRLLRKPWFFSVRGNHEDMMLRWGAHPPKDRATLRVALKNGEGWLYSLTLSERNELEHSLLPLVSKLPRLLRVGLGQTAYQVVHAQVADTYGIPWLDEALSDGRVLRSASLLWGRQLFDQLKQQHISDARARLPFSYATPAMQKGLRLTYAGHNAVPHPILYRSHLFIDCGVWSTQATRKGSMRILDNGEVFSNLGVFSDTIPLG